MSSASLALGQFREADQVGEQDRHDPPLGDRSGRGSRSASSTAAAAPPRAVPQSPQNRFPGGLSAPQVGQPEASGAPQSPQKRLSAGFSVPQLGQTTFKLPRDEYREGTTRPPRREHGVLRAGAPSDARLLGAPLVAGCPGAVRRVSSDPHCSSTESSPTEPLSQRPTRPCRGEHPPATCDRQTTDYAASPLATAVSLVTDPPVPLPVGGDQVGPERPMSRHFEASPRLETRAAAGARDVEPRPSSTGPNRMPEGHLPRAPARGLAPRAQMPAACPGRGEARSAPTSPTPGS